MIDKIEITGKKAANVVIMGGCYGTALVSGAIGGAAALGELGCWAIRMGAEKIEDAAYGMYLAGGPFKLDEEKSKEKANEILTQYL